MELNENIIKSAYNLMEMITKDYQWYTDTPEQPFELSQGSIWLINPDTKEWMLELNKSGRLGYYYKTYDTFSMYLNMDEPDFQSFIKVWVEYVLKRGVISTCAVRHRSGGEVEYVLKRGVVSTEQEKMQPVEWVEYVLKRGVVLTDSTWDEDLFHVEYALKRGVVSKPSRFRKWWVEVKEIFKIENN
jgi:hypothetical protein